MPQLNQDTFAMNQFTSQKGSGGGLLAVEDDEELMNLSKSSAYATEETKHLHEESKHLHHETDLPLQIHQITQSSKYNETPSSLTP